jgi:hypothetical protein
MLFEFSVWIPMNLNGCMWIYVNLDGFIWKFVDYKYDFFMWIYIRIYTNRKNLRGSVRGASTRQYARSIVLGIMCLAVILIVYDSAHGSVWQYGSVRQCALPCAEVCGSVWQCACMAVCGSALYKYIYEKSLTTIYWYVLIGAVGMSPIFFAN